MKKFNLTFAFLLSLSNLFSQVELANPEKLVCPGEIVHYGAYPSTTNGCTYKWTVTNGKFNNGKTTIEGFDLRDVYVTWDNVLASSNVAAPKGTLKVEVVTSSCTVPSGEDTEDTEDNIVIKTLNNVTPEAISGNSSVEFYAGSSSYSIPKVLYPNTNIEGGWPFPEYADSYQWIIPAGWELSGVTSDGTTPITNQSNDVLITPNNCGGDGEKIKVRAYSDCGNGYTSNWQELTINRVAPSVSFSQPPPDFLVCNDTDPITVSVSTVTGASSYTWTKPTGWSGSSTSNSITLTPNGTDGGDITVKANICGEESNPLSKTVVIEPFHPENGPEIQGPQKFCTSETYEIGNLPAMATVDWAYSGGISGPASGNPIEVTETSSGDATLTATITSCGVSETVSKSLKVGAIPVIPNIVSGGSIRSYSDPSNLEVDICAYENDNDIHIDLPGVQNLQAYPYTGSTYPQVVGTSVYWSYPMGNTSATLRLDYDVECGAITQFITFYNMCGGTTSTYSTSPNPAGDKLIIERVEFLPITSNDSDQKKVEIEVKLYNKYSEVVLLEKTKKRKTILNTSSLPNGLYYLHITDRNGNIVREQILIEH